MAGRRRGRRPAGPPALDQHFLRSSRLAASLVEAAGIERGDLVYDVGAGAGIISAELLRRGARVVAIELDPTLAARLRARFGASVEVVEDDVLRRRWPRETFKVVANLPFGRGTAILRTLLTDPSVPFAGGDVILQWETAWKRAAPWPSTLLGVVWGARYELRVVRRLSRTAFAPPPDVDAAVLRIIRRPEPLVAPRDARAFQAFVGRAFAGTPLARLVAPRVLKRLAAELGFDPRARARDLDAEQWAALFGSIRAVR